MKILRILEAGPGQVLALDIDGKPLRAGDSVVIVGSTYPGVNGAVMQVMEPCLDRAWADVRLSPVRDDGLFWCAWGRDLRRIDTPDSASWDQVTESTGWKPSREKVREVVEQ